MQNLILYHANCSDGFGAAFAIYLSMKNHAEYIGVSHDEKLDYLLSICAGKDVIMVDIAFSKDYMIQLEKVCYCINVYDHHISAKESMENLKFCHFDLTRSGAMLAWNLFNPNQKDNDAPLLIQYIQDNDLWKHEMPNSKEFTAWFQNEPFEFSVYEKYLDVGEIKKAIDKGKTILLNMEKQFSKIIHNAYRFEKQDYAIIIINSCLYQSELGNYLCNSNPDVDAVIVWYQNKKKQFVCSVRSTKEKAVVIARIFSESGGGHLNAAGFKTEFYPFV